MLLSSRRDVPLLRTITGFEWDVAPFPTDVEPASVLHSDGFCMAKGADTDAAWAWIEFALGREGQQVLARSGRSVPSLRAVAESPAFLDPGEPPASSRVFLDALEHMHRLPTTEHWTELEQRADDILQELYYGRLGIDAALERLARETDGKF
jgi:multiple sugar transport system substrate-binding protein